MTASTHKPDPFLKENAAAQISYIAANHYEQFFDGVFSYENYSKEGCLPGLLEKCETLFVKGKDGHVADMSHDLTFGWFIAYHWAKLEDKTDKSVEMAQMAGAELHKYLGLAITGWCKVHPHAKESECRQWGSTLKQKVLQTLRSGIIDWGAKSQNSVTTEEWLFHEDVKKGWLKKVPENGTTTERRVFHLIYEYVYKEVNGEREGARWLQESEPTFISNVMPVYNQHGLHDHTPYSTEWYQARQKIAAAAAFYFPRRMAEKKQIGVLGAMHGYAHGLHPEDHVHTQIQSHLGNNNFTRRDSQTSLSFARQLSTCRVHHTKCKSLLKICPLFGMCNVHGRNCASFRLLLSPTSTFRSFRSLSFALLTYIRQTRQPIHHCVVESDALRYNKPIFLAGSAFPLLSLLTHGNNMVNTLKTLFAALAIASAASASASAAYHAVHGHLRSPIKQLKHRRHHVRAQTDSNRKERAVAVTKHKRASSKKCKSKSKSSSGSSSSNSTASTSNSGKFASPSGISKPSTTKSHSPTPITANSTNSSTPGSSSGSWKYPSAAVRVNGVVGGMLPDGGGDGGSKDTMSSLNSLIASTNLVHGTFGQYAQAQGGTLFDGSQLTQVMDDLKESGAIFEPAVMPTPGSAGNSWWGLTSSDNQQAVAICKAMTQFTDAGITVRLRFAHEVNWYQTDGTYSGDNNDFIEGWNTVAAACKQYAPEVHMFWTPNVASLSQYETFAPDMSTVALIGIDYYPTQSDDLSTAFLNAMQPFHDKYCSESTEFAIGETGLGYAGSADQKVQWLNSAFQAKSQMQHLTSVSWFNYQKGYNFKIADPADSSTTSAYISAIKT